MRIGTSSTANLEPRDNSGRLVIQNLIDLRQDLRRQLIDGRDSAHIIIDLLDRARARDGGADVGVLEDPRERQHAHLDAQARGDGREAVDLGDDLVELGLARALPPAGDELDLLGAREARVLGHAVLVLARQQALAQRREDGEPRPHLAVEVRVLDLDALARKHVVLGLLGDGAHEPEAVGVAPGLGDLVGVPHRRAPVQRLARADEVVEGAHRLLHGCLSVCPVRVDDVYVVEAEALERGVHALEDVLPGQARVVHRVVAEGRAPVELCRDISKKLFLNSYRHQQEICV